jgi:4-carboxymuconolactone decarboxylase
MSELTPRERELVALGAAMGSNCVPCVEYHTRESQRVGLTDLEIRSALEYADKIRQVPARKVLEAALNLLPTAASPMEDAGNLGVSEARQPLGTMHGMMSQMMSACGCFDQSAKGTSSSEKKPTPGPTTSEESKCC